VRDLIVFLLVIGSLPFAFQRPFIGLMMFSWLAYMRPQDLCWGFARGIRFSFYMALAMIIGWIANETSKRPFFRTDIRTSLMLLLLTLVTVGYALAENQEKYVTRYYIEFVKIIVVGLFTTGQVDSKPRLRLMYWMIAGSLGFYGFKTGFFGILRGGAPVMRGPGGLLEDNNDFALALVMNIPLLYYLGRAEKKKWIRQLCDFVILMTMAGVLLTHSRGAFLAMSVTLMFLSWRSGRLLQAGLVMALLAVAFFLFAPEHVLERIALIGEGTQESSAAARIKAWTIGLRMAEANPVFGVGIRNFQDHWERHAHGFDDTGFKFVAHNSYIQILAEGGVTSIVTYLTLLASVFVGMARIRHLTKRRPDFEWAYNYARMMEATILGFMIGAVFLNRGHFDLVYHWFGLTTCLALVFRSEWRKEAMLAPVRAQAAERDDTSAAAADEAAAAAAEPQRSPPPADGRRGRLPRFAPRARSAADASGRVWMRGGARARPSRQMQAAGLRPVREDQPSMARSDSGTEPLRARWRAARDHDSTTGRRWARPRPDDEASGG
jgi:probable O-glycosylation ligase (exosortase A-associated)